MEVENETLFPPRFQVADICTHYNCSSEPGTQCDPIFSHTGCPNGMDILDIPETKIFLQKKGTCHRAVEGELTTNTTLGVRPMVYDFDPIKLKYSKGFNCVIRPYGGK